MLGSLITNTWRIWRRNALNKLDINNDCVKVEGLDTLQKALDSDRGIIIITLHTLGHKLVVRLLRQISQKEISGISWAGRIRDPDHVTATLARKLIDVFQQLEKGGIIYIAADGREGHAHIKVPLYNHIFPIRTGFAEVALRTGATVVAVFIHFNLDGSIKLEFSPLKQPAPGSRGDQVRELAEQYTQKLSTRLNHFMPSLDWHTLDFFMPMDEIFPAKSVDQISLR